MHFADLVKNFEDGGRRKPRHGGYFDMAVAILFQLQNGIQSRQEIFVSLSGDPHTPKGQFFTWIRETGFDLLNKAAELESNGQMTFEIDTNSNPPLAYGPKRFSKSKLCDYYNFGCTCRRAFFILQSLREESWDGVRSWQIGNPLLYCGFRL